MVAGGLGWQKWGFLHMLICSFVHFYLVCEHLFTFQFCALMSKIYKENLRTPPLPSYRATPTLLEGDPYPHKWHNGALGESSGRHIVLCIFEKWSTLCNRRITQIKIHIPIQYFSCSFCLHVSPLLLPSCSFPWLLSLLLPQPGRRREPLYKR